MMMLIMLSGCLETGISGAAETIGGADDTGLQDQGPSLTGQGPTVPEMTAPEPLCAEEGPLAGAVELDESCALVPADAFDYDGQVLWSRALWTTDSDFSRVSSSPIVVPLVDDNGDGVADERDVPAIVAVTTDARLDGTGLTESGKLRAVRGDTGAEIWTASWDAFEYNGNLAAADIDGDGWVEICGPSALGVACVEHDGTFKWENDELDDYMSMRANSVSISDMDGDGSPEVVVGAAILDAEGNILGLGEEGLGGKNLDWGGGLMRYAATASVVADLNGDGTEEVLVGNAAYDIDGDTLWSNGEDDGYVAVADFDLDGDGEMAVSAINELRIQDHGGNVLCTASLPSAYGAGGPPVIADFDGDGVPEVGVTFTNLFGVYESDCSQLWSSAVYDYCPGTASAAATDFAGDGVFEAVVADFVDLHVFAGPDGATEMRGFPHKSGSSILQPVVADVDGDGQIEIVYTNHDSGVGAGFQSGITVVEAKNDNWAAGGRIWNQHAFSESGVNPDGSIPTAAHRPWLDSNTFRGQSTTSTLAPAIPAKPDLSVVIDDLCEIECEQGRIELWVAATNHGHADLPKATELLIYGVTPTGNILLAREPVESLPAGERTASRRIVLEDLGDLELLDLEVLIDGGSSFDGGDGVLDECVETNNTVSWGASICAD